jgi:hypothetical protein
MTATAARCWLIGPTFDLLFVANLAWPAIALLALLGTADTYQQLLFAQIYLITTPHRWITLALVFLDRDLFWAEPARFTAVGLGLVGLGLVLIAVSGSLLGPSRALLLLIAVDFAWNGWHFAAQHAGIARIYGRLGRPDQSLASVTFERRALRGLVLWTFARLAIYLLGTQQVSGLAWLTPEVRGYLAWADLVALTPAVAVVLREAMSPSTLGRQVYLGSMVLLYAASLVALTIENVAAIKAILLTGAAFHATEYLAVVGWSMPRRRGSAMAFLLPRLGLVLASFMLILMATNAWADRAVPHTWVVVTLLVSLLHYGYDGMIWKTRKT